MNISRQFIKLSKPIIERFPSVDMFYRYIRDNGQALDTLYDTPFGFKLVGHSSMGKGTFEPQETQLIRRILSQWGDIVVNVGANIGYYCCLALAQRKHVIAFEPMRGNLNCLYKNIRTNNWENQIEIFPTALSNKLGIAEIFGGGTGASLIKGWANIPEKYVEYVPVSTLDTILGSRLYGKNCLFIVDIEGAERGMLEGATLSLVATPKPIWMVEISISEHQPRGISINPHLLPTFQTFWDNGYEAWTADNHLRPVQPIEVENIVKTGKDSLLTHNFLFIEPNKKKELL